MKVGLEVNVNRTWKAFSSLEKRQYPYALARALTMTAKDGQSAIRGRTKRTFDLRGKFTLRNLRVRSAKKSDVVSKSRAFSEVYTDPRIPYMPQHEPGDIKTARESKYIAVPMRDIKKRRYRTSRGTKSSYLPSNLIKERNVFTIKSNKTGSILMVRRKQKPKKTIKTSTVQTTSSRAKTKRRQKPLEFLWTFVKRAKIKPTWQFERTIKQRASRTFKKHFRQSMRKAVATAR